MAVRGLLDYARPGPLVLGKVSLFKLVSETLKFVEHQPMFRSHCLAMAYSVLIVDDPCEPWVELSAMKATRYSLR